ncbi:MAG: hypothetical protein QXG01_00065 [Candidatus Bathyarchaeia archaeon]
MNFHHLIITSNKKGNTVKEAMRWLSISTELPIMVSVLAYIGYLIGKRFGSPYDMLGILIGGIFGFILGVLGIFVMIGIIKPGKKSIKFNRVVSFNG